MRKSKKDEKIIEVDPVKVAKVIIIRVMCAIAVIVCIGAVKSFMTVSKYEINGDSPYEREDVITASGIKYGDKLYDIDEDAVIERIKFNCPYISEVKIKSIFPGTVRISLESYKAAWYVEIFGDYYALDEDLRVLEENADNRKFVIAGIPQLTLPNIKQAIVGSTLIYGDNDSEIKFAEEFMEMAKKTAFKSRLTFVDIDNRFDIYIHVGGNVIVYMGGTADTKAKLDAVEKALDDPKMQNAISAEIDVSNPSMVYIRPVYDYGNQATDTPEDNGGVG